jgi:hypothetical protein
MACQRRIVRRERHCWLTGVDLGGALSGFGPTAARHLSNQQQIEQIPWMSYAPRIFFGYSSMIDIPRSLSEVANGRVLA